MGTVHGLILDGRIPPPVEEEDVLRELEVEPDGAGAVGEEEDGVAAVVLEPLDRLVAGGRRHPAVVLQRTEGGEFLLELAERLDPLAEDERLPAARLHLLEIGLETVELGALAGVGVEIAHLLEPEDELKDMADRRRPPHVGQPEDSILLGLPVGLALFGRELDPFVAVEPGREILEDLVLCPPQDMVGCGGAEGPR